MNSSARTVSDLKQISAREKKKREYLKLMDFMAMFGEDSPFYKSRLSRLIIEEFPMEMLNASNEDLIDIGNRFLEMAANRRANGS
jgi:hypothetical protein